MPPEHGDQGLVIRRVQVDAAKLKIRRARSRNQAVDPAVEAMAMAMALGQRDSTTAPVWPAESDVARDLGSQVREE